MLKFYKDRKAEAVLIIVVLTILVLGVVAFFNHHSTKEIPAKKYILAHSEVYRKEFVFSSKYDKYVDKQTGKVYLVYKWPFNWVIEEV